MPNRFFETDMQRYCAALVDMGCFLLLQLAALGPVADTSAVARARSGLLLVNHDSSQRTEQDAPNLQRSTKSLSAIRQRPF